MNFKAIFTVGLMLVANALVADLNTNPTLAMDTNGNVLAVWLDQDSLSILSNTYIGGSWGATPSVIMTGGTVTSPPIVGVHAVSSTEISAVVVWSDVDMVSGGTAIFAAMLPTSSGSWTSVAELALAPNETVNTDYALRVNNSTGDVVVVYTAYNMMTGDQPVKSSNSTINSLNSWTTPTAISTP